MYYQYRMKRLIFILLAIVLTGCNAGVSMVPFKTISKQTIPVQDAVPRIIVISKPQTVVGILSKDQVVINDFDYSHDVLIIGFLGYGDYAKPWVTKISQLKAATGNLTIWVQADIPPSTSGESTVNYQIVSVHKSDIVKLGDILIRLTNPNFSSKAYSEAYIP
jgi:hypothetical protein